MSETPKNGTARNGAIVFLIVLAGIAGFGAYRHFSASPTAEPPVAPAVKGDAVTTPPASPEAAAGTAATAPAAPAATEPARPAAVALSAAPPAFDVVRVLPSGDATIAGRSSPGAEIAIYANGAVIGRTTATENGEWVIVLDRPLSPGEYELTVTSVARGGKSELEGTERVAVSLPQDRKEQPLVAIV
ncbi:Ig-like domain-containing protein, partial [Pseudoxanthobacter sp.]|uniref:Ig-like domain-containing protein n=1 Tax=Pseudoxanthobacter sp. TaxID=1925742 RepID=UPI002FDF79B9